VDLKLVGKLGNAELQHPLAESPQLIGRAEDADLRLPHPSVSRHHAEISLNGGRVTVRDLGSHNGTFVNSARVVEPTALQVGDTLELANLSFRVVGPEGAENFDTPDLTRFTSPDSLISSAEISWDEVRKQRRQKRDRQSLLFRVLAEAGDLLTIQRAPEEMFEPTLDLVETALAPERTFILLLEEGIDDPVVKAFRDTTGGKGEDLVLSQTMVKRVLTQKTSFLTTDAQDQPGTDPVMSMVSQGIRAAIAAPLFDNEEVIGVLYADNTRPNWHLSRDELSAFTMLANVIAVALSHARYHAMEEEKQRQDAEMTAATEILRNILPAELPACDGYDLSAHLEPCYDVGGDLYDAYSLPDGRHAFFIGDVTGKGLGAALLVSHLISLTRFMLDEGFEPAELMRRLNQQIYRCTDHVRFATFFIGFLDPQSGRIQYANAGHNAPLVIRANGETGSCPATGLPVGIMEDSVYETGELSLNDEDLLALFSDGITETQRDEEEEYGDDRFRELLVRERGKDLPAIFGTLQGELRSFRGEEPVGDDVTLMLLRKNHYSGGPHAR